MHGAHRLVAVFLGLFGDAQGLVARKWWSPRYERPGDDQRAGSGSPCGRGRARH